MQVEFLGIPRERAGLAEVEIEGETLGQVLDAVARRFPRLRDLVADGRLHPSLAASLNADVFITDPATRLANDDRLLILSADAGG
jgi:molybdopterin converting factor small subunit